MRRFNRIRILIAGGVSAPVAGILVSVAVLAPNLVTSFRVSAPGDIAGQWLPLVPPIVLLGTVVALPVCLLGVFAATMLAERLGMTRTEDARRFGTWIGAAISVLVFAVLLFGPTLAALRSGGGEDLSPRSLRDMVRIVIYSLLFFPIPVIVAHVARAVMGEPSER